MEIKKIYLGNFENAVRFLKSVERVRADLYLESEDTSVNAKSILGIFSLNLSKPLTLKIAGSEQDRQIVNEAIREYIA